ncbi:MAG: transglycosylase SLT domain-containing protein [Anaerolineales bacterium]|nr:transglycosylase SLT domain-containing protein [Anaerolineales bacterium]
MQRAKAIFLLLVLLAACTNKPDAGSLPAGDLTSLAAGQGTVAGVEVLHLPTITPSATVIPTFTPSPSPTPSPIPTPTPTPTPTPQPGVLLEEALRDMNIGDYQSAIQLFHQITTMPDVSEDDRQAAALGTGEAFLRLGLFDDAETSLAGFLALYPDSTKQANATYWLAQARQGLMDWQGALDAFEAYLALDSTLVTYVSGQMADCYLALDDPAAAVSAYERALTGAANNAMVIDIRERLARAYQSAGELDAAIQQYDAIPSLTNDKSTLARVEYLAGYALILSGRAEEGYQRYLYAIQNYPSANDSYRALIDLVEAGIPVDDFQRGLVDYYAEAYIPAISAFYRHIEADPISHRADAHIYLSRSYVELGNYETALSELDILLQTHQDDPDWSAGYLEKADVYDAMDDVESAVSSYLELADTYPADKNTPLALWKAAALREYDESWMLAHDLYRRLAVDYPYYEDTPRALFRGGLMAYFQGETGMAAQDWDTLVQLYPGSEWTAPALIWLMKILPQEETQAYRSLAVQLPPDEYYAIRASDIVSGVLPFDPPPALRWPDFEQEEMERHEAITWLENWLQRPVEDTLPSIILSDPRWERGRRLWELGMRGEARIELEQLRVSFVNDPAASYQLAIAFRDMGLFRSSIISAFQLIQLSDAISPLDVPPFIARLSYPVYYLDLVEPIAAEYNVDPLLIFALIRQESLFEGFATSWAYAQGLMQIIPSTGQDIANKLAWPNYSNQDLYKPYLNVKFGIFYLAEQLDLFDGKEYVALSAYNGGPGNALYWQSVAPDDLDLYVEVIYLSETRKYVQRIYNHYTIYRALYGAE